MINSNIKITVIVITYNQEDVIGRALDSILVQAQWGLKDIIVCDDCSSDNNWTVIQKYKTEYPQYIRAYRNDKNKGIYGNLQSALDYIEDTDIVYMCSGDDAFCHDLFKHHIQFINNKKLRPLQESFVIYNDWEVRFTAPKPSKVFSNSILCKSQDVKSLKLRQLISGRGCCSSITLIKKYNKVPLDKGLSVAEQLFDMQRSLHSDYNYYVPYVGAIYYAGIGISTKLNNKAYIIDLCNSYTELVKQYKFDNKDILYVEYKKHRLMYKYNKTFRNFIRVWLLYFKSLKYGLNVRFVIKDTLKMLFLNTI